MVATEVRTAIERVEQAIERSMRSRQDRFRNAELVFSSIYNWIEADCQDEPPYKSDSRTRDAWLAAAWRSEPHLAGVLNGAVAIDKNRSWEITGPRRQVTRQSRMLHASIAHPGLVGWRNYASCQSLSFYTADINAVTELGREGRDGPVRQLWHVDPTRCSLTGDHAKPLAYHATGEPQPWPADSFFRIASMPCTRSEFNGLGFCAVSRCIELTKLMIAVYQHDAEQVGARAPRGLLLLQNISEEQWRQALQARELREDNLERRYFGGVMTLATEGVDLIDAKIVALSQLPQNFDQKIFVDLLMYGYALSFGYDPSEFWPVQYGALGRGEEASIQHRKATGKGGIDFVNGMQEAVQNVMPATTQFSFEHRDDEGDLTEAKVMQARINNAVLAYEAGKPIGGGGFNSLDATSFEAVEPKKETKSEGSLLTRDEARSLLVTWGVIPESWTEAEEDIVFTEEQRARRSKQRVADQLIATRDTMLPRVRRMALDDEIVAYHWPSGVTVKLFDSGLGML